MRSSFFAKENLIHPHIFTVIFTLYPFYSIIEQNIAYTQNFIAKCKRYFTFLTQKFWPKAGQNPHYTRHIYCEVNFEG